MKCTYMKKEAFERGYEIAAGMDEAGRGLCRTGGGVMRGTAEILLNRRQSTIQKAESGQRESFTI